MCLLICHLRFKIFVLETIKFEWQWSQYLELNLTYVNELNGGLFNNNCNGNWLSVDKFICFVVDFNFWKESTPTLPYEVMNFLFIKPWPFGTTNLSPDLNHQRIRINYLKIKLLGNEKYQSKTIVKPRTTHVWCYFDGCGGTNARN